MMLKVSYFDHTIALDGNSIFSVEIENKNYFYRFVSDLNSVSVGNVTEELKLFDQDENEVTASTKFNIIIDYFNLDFNTKKYNLESQKLIKSSIDEKEYETISKYYRKLKQEFIHILQDVDLPFTINDDIDLDVLVKLLKISISNKEDLISKLLLLIDVNKILDSNKVLTFINLKQYLKKEELTELYKYAIYNQARLLLIDSQAHGVKMDNEKKLIIDDDLAEIML